MKIIFVKKKSSQLLSQTHGLGIGLLLLRKTDFKTFIYLK